MGAELVVRSVLFFRHLSFNTLIWRDVRRLFIAAHLVTTPDKT